MDFAFDKYDLFNAPQYVDFNEFVRNDGFGNDNADDFFRHHREEDDFFPNDDLSPTAILQQDQTQMFLLKAEPEVKNKSCEVQNSKSVADCQTPSVQIQAAKPQPQPCRATPGSKNYYIEVDYEEELRLAEEAKAAKAKKILELEEIERMKIKAKLEEAGRAFEQAEIEKKKMQAELPPSEMTVQADHSGEHEPTKSSNAEMAQDEKEQTEECSVTAESVARPPMEAEVGNLKATINKHVTIMDSNSDDGSAKQQLEVAHEADPIGDTAVNTHPRDLSEHKNKNHSNIPIKGHNIPVPKKAALKITVPQPFKFAELRPRKAQQETNSEQFKFKAKPAPLKILKGESIPVVKPPPKVTQPMEIHFASEDRIRERNLKLRKSVPAPVVPVDTARKPKSAALSTSRSTIESAPSVEKVDACTSSSSNFRSRTPNKSTKTKVRTRSLSADRNRPTHVQPFSFEERDKELQRKKEEKIRNAIKEDIKLKEFHAHPVPKFPKRLPPRHPAPLTAVKPFRFKCDERGMSYQQEFQRKVEEETKSLKQQAEFTAQPNTTIYRKPFEPERSNVPLAEPLDIVLHTDRRAPERSRFDVMIKEKEAELEELRRQEQLMKEEQEKQLCATLRHTTVHKAKPAPKNRMFELKNSERPLTEPKSPAFELLPSQRRTKLQENKENVK